MEAFGIRLDQRAVRLERTLPGPIERVWAYLTEEDKRAKWLCSGKWDLRPGGKITLIFNNSTLSSDKETPARFKDGECREMGGEIVRYEPPRLLSFTWNTADEPSEVTFELTPKGNDVLFLITHRRLADRQQLVLVSSGWHTHVGVLIDVLRNEEPRPFWKSFLQVEQEYEKRISE